jgi:hypothetical protein
MLGLALPSLARAQASGPSDADSQPSVAYENRLAVGSMLGFGTPVGLIGATVMHHVLPQVSYGAGLGTNSVGLQLAILVDFRPFVWERRRAAHALHIGTSVSTGPWQALQLGFFNALDHSGPEERALDFRYVSDRAYWLQFDLGYSLVTAGGFWLRAAPGVARMLNPDDAHCELIQTGESTPCTGGVHSKGGLPSDPIYTFTVVVGYAALL